MNNQSNIFEYLETYNTRDIEALEIQEQLQLEREEQSFELQVGRGTRTFAVDQDLLAQFIELQLRIVRGNALIEDTQSKIDELQARLDAAKAGNYLPKPQFSAILNTKLKLVERIKKLKDHRKALAAERKNTISSDSKACWSRWFQLVGDDQKNIQAAEAELDKYLNTPVIDYFDPEDIDNQADLHGGYKTTMDCLLDTHLQEEAEYNNNFKADPYLSSDWWDRSYQYKLDNKQREMIHLAAMEEQYLGRDTEINF